MLFDIQKHNYKEHNELEIIHSFMIKFNLEKNMTSCIYNERKQSRALTLSIASGSGAGTLEEKERLLMVYGDIGSTDTML